MPFAVWGRSENKLRVTEPKQSGADIDGYLIFTDALFPNPEKKEYEATTFQPACPEDRALVTGQHIELGNFPSSER